MQKRVQTEFQDLKKKKSSILTDYYLQDFQILYLQNLYLDLTN